MQPILEMNSLPLNPSDDLTFDDVPPTQVIIFKRTNSTEEWKFDRLVVGRIAK
jgi:hypothetical protein